MILNFIKIFVDILGSNIFDVLKGMVSNFDIQCHILFLL